MIWKGRNISRQETNIHFLEHYRISVRDAYLRFILPGFSMEEEGGKLPVHQHPQGFIGSVRKNRNVKNREAC
ncbi:MAG TPA: hypothetical protein PKV73_06275 [Agriterribacter sp.]|nr:hypothetical protein [Agriterribacter sp.]